MLCEGELTIPHLGNLARDTSSGEQARQDLDLLLVRRRRVQATDPSSKRRQILGCDHAVTEQAFEEVPDLEPKAFLQQQQKTPKR